MQTILGVWAHPDDEIYLSGGLMAAARRRGDRVVVVHATHGEAGGSIDVRDREMETALQYLDVHEHRDLDFPDGGCADVPVALGAARVAAVIADVQPDLVVTFGPDGITGHPDHCTVSDWTTAAWRASDRRARLRFATFTPEFYAQWGTTTEHVGIWMSDERPCTPPEHIALKVVCHSDVLEQKMAALRAHASQTDQLRAAVGDEAFGQMFATEWFADGANTNAGARLA